MLLGDLLSDRELGLVLLAGEDQLDRPVRDVYITDLIDPRRYLSGGELVLSGLVWRNDPGDSDRFVAALAAAGVAGLAAGTARLGRAPHDLVEACRKYRIPAFEVPLSVSFNTLADRVRRAAPHRELVSAVAAGADLDQVLAMAAEEFGTDCWVLSGAGRLVGGSAEFPDELTDHVIAGAGRPRTLRADRDYVLWPVESDIQPPAARWFLLVRAEAATWSQDQEAIATDLATVVSLVRSRVDEARRIAGRSVEAALRRLLDGTSGPVDVAAHLESAGLPTGVPLRIVSLHVDGIGEGVPAATALLREIAAATGPASITAPFGDGATAVFAGEADDLAGLDDRLRRLAARTEPGLGSLRLAIGVSDVSGIAGLRGAIEEAGHARRLAQRGDGRSRVVSAADLASHAVLLSSLPDELRSSYRRRLLSPLAAYDRAHHSDLLRTLRAFLDCSGSWSRCAKLLHVHVNTLRYRIRRIEEITGRDLAEFADRVDFYLALELEQAEHP